MFANHRYIKVTKEGDPLLLFDGPGEPLPPDEIHVEPKKKWRYSIAKKLLLKDIKDKKIMFGDDDKPLMPLEDIYCMHEQYAEYKFEKFEDRVEAARKKDVELNDRAEKDAKALEAFMEHNEVSHFTSRGFIQWQGSEAQELLLEDIAEKMHITMGYKRLFLERFAYWGNFEYDDFKEKIKQEIKTAKKVHTFEVRGKQN